MDTRRTFAILSAVLALSAAAMAADQVPAEDAGAEFRGAFAEGVPLAESAHILIRLVKEDPRSEWADDALWVLGEMARQQRLPHRVVYFWQYLMASRSDAELEEFTRSLELYRKSPLHNIMVVMEADGTAFVPDGAGIADGRSFFVAKPFNAVPMSVWEELGRSYLTLDKPALALKAYQKALACAPEHGRWQSTYGARILELERRVDAVSAGPSGGESDGAAGLGSTKETGASSEHEQESRAGRTQAG